MNLGGVFFLLGRLLTALSVSLLVPAVVAHFDGGQGLSAFLVSAAIAATAGIILERRFVRGGEFTFGRQEAFVLVASAWAVATLVGTLPYVFLKGPGFLVNGIFESASGFTTTGASILPDVESESAALLLWRALTQWLGGMGIIVLGIAVLPKLAIGGMELLGAEAPGPVKEKLTPRLAQTGKALWGIYTIFTAAEIVILMSIGMGPLDAVAHSFATMATGGFSTHDTSVAYYDSAAVDGVVTVFMLVGGINFMIYFRVATEGWQRLLQESELKFFALLLATACLITVITLRLTVYPHWGEAVRFGVFQVASIISTTGFATADFEPWPYLIQAILITMMFTGAMAGSTSGAMKNVRVLLLFKQGFQQLRLLVHPHAVTRVRLSGQAVAPEIIHAIWGFFFLYLVVFAVATLCLAGEGLDLVTASTAVITAMGNVGPGLGEVGPMENFAALPAAAKWILSVCMLLGRLEIYTVLVLFLPEYWRR